MDGITKETLIPCEGTKCVRYVTLSSIQLVNGEFLCLKCASKLGVKK